MSVSDHKGRSMSDLESYGSGNLMPFGDWKAVRGAREARRETYIAAAQAQGAVELGEFIMSLSLQFDGTRRQLSGDDEMQNQILMAIELNTLRSLSDIQGRLFKPQPRFW